MNIFIDTCQERTSNNQTIILDPLSNNETFILLQKYIGLRETNCGSAGHRWQVLFHKSPQKKIQTMSPYSVRSTKLASPWLFFTSSSKHHSASKCFSFLFTGSSLACLQLKLVSCERFGALRIPWGRSFLGKWRASGKFDGHCC